jgi:hypothetical protein
MDEAARDVEDAGRIVEMVAAHLGRRRVGLAT